MHTTKHKDIIGFIDNFKENEENIFLNGWAFHEIYPSASIRLKYDINDFNCEVYLNNTQFSTSRWDVAESYKKREMAECGWKFSLKKEKNIIKNLEVQMNFENKWNTFFSFLMENSDSFSDQDTSKIIDFKIIPKKYIPSFIVVDNFYNEVDKIRNFALKQEFSHHPNQHKGKRTEKTFCFEGLKESFEFILGNKIKNWEIYGVNGCFQTCIAGDTLVYHHDQQEYAGILFLTPDAPHETGTSFYRSKYTKKTKVEEKDAGIVFKNGFLDSTQFDLVDVVGNVYNRLVLFDAQLIHAASNYFGNSLENSRLFQLFFFDLER